MTAPPVAEPKSVAFKKWMLVVEGNSDECFLRNLCRIRGIPDYGVFYGTLGNMAAGKDGFEEVLRALRVMPGFEIVEGLIVVTDSDSDPATSFKSACAQLQTAGYRAPAAPLAWSTRAPDAPPACVMLLPWHDQPGDLEHLLIPAIKDKWPTEFACVESFAACTGADQFPLNKIGKMLTRAFLSGRVKPDPNVGLGQLWDRAWGNQHIPLEHSAFNRVSEFLLTRSHS